MRTAFLAIAGILAAGQAMAAPLTMEQISGAPFPAYLTAAPDREAVAWMYNERGARNIWVATLDGSGRALPRRLTDYRGDDGVDIAGLGWTGDDRALVYVRGGDGGGRTAVNPTSAAGGPAAGVVTVVPVEGGAPRPLAQGVDPAPAPKGDLIAFTRNGQPYLVHAAGGDAVAAWIDQGAVGSLSWSPDGSRIAFVSKRAQHALIGVYEVASKAITWIAPGTDIDRDPIWSPDGRQLAFLRLPSDGLGLPGFVARRDGYPWEIWTADAATGEGRRVWRADPGVGSRFRELFNSRRSLFWMADGTLYFPWEKTGWVRLYALPARGGAPRLVTPGDAEVFGAEPDAARTRLVFSSNLGDLDRRHIWSIDAGGAPRQITRGEGVEDMPVQTRGRRVFVLRGNARTPMRPALLDGAGLADVAPQAIPVDFPTDELVTPELVTFKAADGVTVHGQLFVPKGRTARGPALLFFHGGPTNRQAFAAWDPFETHTRLYETNQYLASRGYVVLSVNYRGGAGYGLDYREAKDFGAGGASELRDIVAAAEYMNRRADVDPAKLGIWGGSYGGRMTLLGMAAAPRYFAAGANYAGVYDWTRMPGYRGDPASDALAFRSAAVGHMDTWRAPVLLMHGDADISVPFDQTALLIEALRKRDIPFETLMMPDEVHFLLRHQSWRRMAEATAAYFDRQLK